MPAMTQLEMSLLTRVAAAVRQYGLFASGDTLVVGVSGGADSVALLDMLTRLPGFELTLVVAHVNHCLRGAASDGDEQFCRELAERYHVTFAAARVDVQDLAQTEQLNLEDAARAARIRFFDQLRDSHRAAAVVLAHHADDQAETVVMRLLRGSGTTGLAGMAYRNGRGYVRPLLGVSRSDIEHYLDSRSCQWRVDASNEDLRYLRNRVRHQLLPLLKQYNPALREVLCASATVLRDDDEALVEQAQQLFATACSTEGGQVSCRIPLLTSVHRAVTRRVLREAYRQIAGSLIGLGHDHIAALLALLAGEQSGKAVSLPQGITAVREYEKLILKKAAERHDSIGYALTVTGVGEYPLPGGGCLVVACCSPGEAAASVDTATLDLDRVPFPWQVRTVAPGDRMIPLGMNGRKKVKDIFIDRKVPRAVRLRVPLLFCGDQLIWIAGVCLAESARLDDTVCNRVAVTYQQR